MFFEEFQNDKVSTGYNLEFKIYQNLITKIIKIRLLIKWRKVLWLHLVMQKIDSTKSNLRIEKKV